uniref:Putative secreted protein n=1 Tax=Anopheles darlingi TaxID=43151 RepID=A0A2M4D405_ANODA
MGFDFAVVLLLLLGFAAHFKHSISSRVSAFMGLVLARLGWHERSARLSQKHRWWALSSLIIGRWLLCAAAAAEQGEDADEVAEEVGCGVEPVVDVLVLPRSSDWHRPIDSPSAYHPRASAVVGAPPCTPELGWQFMERLCGCEYNLGLFLVRTGDDHETVHVGRKGQYRLVVVGAEGVSRAMLEQM